jgi:adenylate kinase family enzyme
MVDFQKEGESSPLLPDIVLLGPDGTGKKTQARFLQDELGYQVIRRSDLIGDLEQWEDPGQIKKFVKKGVEMTCPELAVHFKRRMFEIIDLKNPTVFINFPKNKPQKEIFDTVLNEEGRGDYAVITLDADGEGEEVFAENLSERTGKYKWQVLEDIKHYRSQIEEVCGEWSAEKRTIESLNPFVSKREIEYLLEYIVKNAA